MRQLSYTAVVLALGATLLASSVVGCRDNGVPTPGSSSGSKGDDDDDGPSSSSSGGSSSGGSSGGARNPMSLRLANFNTRNLFNDKDDSNVADETIETPADYQNHLKEIATALATLDADVVILVEVENKAVLEDLIARSEISGKYEHYELLPGNDPRGINIGIVSNLPIDEAVTHRSDSIAGELGNYRYSRDVPEFHLSKNGNPFTLLGVHFKAKDEADVERDNDKRLAEARGARKIADALLEDDANGAVVLLGDFNDDTDSPSTEAIKGSDPEFSHAVGVKPAADQWTVSYGGDRMTYDDQWASPALASARDADSVLILRVPAAVSDHAAVAATYDFE